MINRHDSHCNTQQRHPHYSGMKCECGVDAGDPHWYRLKLGILDKLLLAFAKCQHYQEFNGRLEKFFKQEIPKYTVVVHPAEKTWDSHQINVWGGGIRYDDGVHIRLYKDHTEGASNSWADMFRRAMKRERKSLEQAIAQLDRENNPVIEETLRLYQHDVTRLLNTAREYAGDVSGDLRKAFPLLFDSEIPK